MLTSIIPGYDAHRRTLDDICELNKCAFCTLDIRERSQWRFAGGCKDAMECAILHRCNKSARIDGVVENYTYISSCTM